MTPVFLRSRRALCEFASIFDRQQHRSHPVTGEFVAFLPLWVLDSAGVPVRLVWDRARRVGFCAVRPQVAGWRASTGESGTVIIGGATGVALPVLSAGFPAVIDGFPVRSLARHEAAARAHVFSALTDPEVRRWARHMVASRVATVAGEDGHRELIDVAALTDRFLLGPASGSGCGSLLGGLERLCGGVAAAAGREVSWLVEHALTGVDASLGLVETTPVPAVCRVVAGGRRRGGGGGC